MWKVMKALYIIWDRSIVYGEYSLIVKIKLIEIVAVLVHVYIYIYIYI